MLTLNQSKGVSAKCVPGRHVAGAWWSMFGAMLLMVLFAVPVMAAEPIPRDFGSYRDEMIPVQGPRQVFRDDLTVERGQVIEDDVFVYSGNVVMRDGSRIEGDLVVFSGNIEIGENATVEGDIISYSGNVDVAGTVDGDLTAMSGDIRLQSTSTVDGDISIVSGHVNRDDLASVGGTVIQGPTFRFSSPSTPDIPRQPGISVESRSGSIVGALVGFILRLVTAAVVTALVVLLVGGLFYLRPQLVIDTRKQLHANLALSAVIGGLANLVVLFLIGLLAATLCLLPLALIPLLALLAVNIIGWAVASQIVGERIVKFAKQTVSPAVTILVGALFLTGAVALLWAFGGCFKFIASLSIFVIASLGAGAVLVPWLNRRWGKSGGGDVPPVGPTPDAPDGGPSPSYATPHYDVPAEGNFADEVVSDGSHDASRGVTAEGFVATDTVEHELNGPIDYVTAEEINSTAEEAAKPKRSRSTRNVESVAPEATEVTSDGSIAGEVAPVEQGLDAPIDYVTAQEVITADVVLGDATAGDDDFLQIKGIGPTYARRLKDAGYQTFAQLATASPEDVAAAIGWPVDRVRRAEVIDQAKMLAR